MLASKEHGFGGAVVFRGGFGISLNEALNPLLQRAPDEAERPAWRRRDRLKPRKVGFGSEIARAKSLAGEISDEHTLRKPKGRR